ncbi:MAG: type I DNA topoisomerase [Oscillospiraceae bacterium]|nr:type I DNA topoisomerase [Oscillospiraceae bacterium]
MAKKQHLVIVESPAKAKTIGKYLGPGYTVVASMGHVRDLPKSKLGVDIEGGFVPEYKPIKGKAELIRELKQAAKTSDKVFLATDPDREGEAISWHLKELLDLPDDRARRVTFNEITQRVVKQSIQDPRDIDMDLVNAQQARRVLDRIVGYQLSPLLWKTIRSGLSAGRVQSVATRLVCERDEEISAFQPEEYWSLEVELERQAPHTGRFTAQFYGREKKIELHSQEQVQQVVDAVTGQPFTVTAVKRRDKLRSPAPPFITSTLQQEASRKLGMTPRRTMSIAQQLYEGVDVAGVGTVGLITYMRTDSLRLSTEAVDAARALISSRYGAAYCPAKPNVYKTKAGAQDAHEAIRPSDVTLVPEELRRDLTADQYRLYKLIWSRFLACQMAPAVYDTFSIETQAAGYTFRASHSSLKFSGFTAVYEEGRDEEGESPQSPLPDLSEGEQASLTGTKPAQHFTQPPARYTEATLIRAMEEKGIGRPSTYAPTISTILSRFYVMKEGKHLRCTNLGQVVTGLMKERFQDIVDYTFTAQMEEQLDQVEQGNLDWKGLLEEFYGGFSQELAQAEQALEGQRIPVPDELSDEVCDVCGRQMVIKNGRFGLFLGCPGFPECTFTKPIVVEMPGKCPRCGGRILKKTSKNGHTYYGCEFNNSKLEGKRCDFMTWDVPVKDICPQCGKTLFKRFARGAKKTFCINEACPLFVPEEQRGGWRKKPAADQAQQAAKPEENKTAGAKKTAGKKTTAKKAAGKASAGTKG